MAVPLDTLIAMQRTKLCIHCRWYRPEPGIIRQDKCTEPRAQDKDLIGGDVAPGFASHQRIWTCGPNAAWWQARDNVVPLKKSTQEAA